MNTVLLIVSLVVGGIIAYVGAGLRGMVSPSRG